MGRFHPLHWVFFEEVFLVAPIEKGSQNDKCVLMFGGAADLVEIALQVVLQDIG